MGIACPCTASLVDRDGYRRRWGGLRSESADARRVRPHPRHRDHWWGDRVAGRNGWAPLRVGQGDGSGLECAWASLTDAVDHSLLDELVAAVRPLRMACAPHALSLCGLRLNFGVRRTSALDGCIFRMAAAPVPLRRPSQRVRLPRTKGATELMSGVQIPGGHSSMIWAPGSAESLG